MHLLSFCRLRSVEVGPREVEEVTSSTSASSTSSIMLYFDWKTGDFEPKSVLSKSKNEVLIWGLFRNSMPTPVPLSGLDECEKLHEKLHELGRLLCAVPPQTS